MSIVIDPRVDTRMGCREDYERHRAWLAKADPAYAEHPHRRALWPFENANDDELTPCEGEAYRDTLHAIYHAAADAATQRSPR